jgi:DNA (cytosine-5)-methyltransferase 1
MSVFRAVSLFSNCGAGDVGYRRAGFRFDVMAEIDKRRLEVCLQNHPGATGVLGDLRTTWPKVVAAYRKRRGDQRPALLCACPPCQGLSSAQSNRGRQEDADAGSRDKRNLLVTVIEKVVKKLEPSVIVVENVTAFLTRKVRDPRNGTPISAARYLVEVLSKDYDAYPLLADLAEFGIPQSRVRSFLTFVRRDVKALSMLARLGRAPYPRPTHLGIGELPSPITLVEALKGFALPRLDAKSREKATVEGYNGFHTVPAWSNRVYEMVAAIPPGTGLSAWENNVCPTCGPIHAQKTAACCTRCREPLLRPVMKAKNGRYRLIRGFASSYRRMHGDRPAATVTTASGHIGSDYTIHPTQNRLLSVLECALLQTFPQDFSWGNALKKYGHTVVREMIGEAVPPAFTELHGEVLIGLLRNGKWTRAPISKVDPRCQRPLARLTVPTHSRPPGRPAVKIYRRKKLATLAPQRSSSRT